MGKEKLLMKGVVLAGGLGTRLYPLTKVTNKHLLPIFNKPMIYYPIKTLVDAGIKNILIVTGGNSAGDFLKLLGNGKEFGLKHINYTYQEGEGGIADALSLAEHFVGNGKFVVILGDNIIEESIKDEVKIFSKQEEGARIILKEVERPERFGVAEIKNSKIVKIVEKPKVPHSNFAVTGIYMYDSYAFDIIKTLKPSERGELEITDVNNRYIKKGTLTYGMLKGWWTDAGTFESLIRANNLVYKKEAGK
jgi:glucose-1-phosphate thymidylyltransferase